MAHFEVEPADLARCRYCGDENVVWQQSKLGRNFLANVKREGDVLVADAFDVHKCREPEKPLLKLDSDESIWFLYPYIIEREDAPHVCLVYARTLAQARALVVAEFGKSHKMSGTRLKPKLGIVWPPT